MNNFCDLQNSPIGIIGSGKLAAALVPYLKKRNMTVSGIFSRNRKTAGKISRHRRIMRFNNISDLVQFSKIIVIAVNDDGIGDIAEKIAGDSLKGKLVTHSSGCLPANILEPAKSAGATVAIVHPLITVSAPKACTGPLENAPIGIFCSGKFWGRSLKKWFSGGGHPVFPLRADERPLYHAAAVLACAGIHQLFLSSAGLLEGAGVCAPSRGKELLAPMSKRAIDLALEPGENLVTGPWIRNDSKVIQLHLKALKKSAPSVYKLYKALFDLSREKPKSASNGPPA